MVQRFTARSKIKARLEDEDQKKKKKKKQKKISNGKFILIAFLTARRWEFKHCESQQGK